MNKPKYSSFFDLGTGFAAAEQIIFGAPYDGTASFRPGSRFGPSAMREAAYGIEYYSPYQEQELSLPIHDAGDLELPFGDPQAVLRQIEEYVRHLVEQDKMPIMIGGEHLLSLAVVRALLTKYPELHIIHLDAHADLRDEYLGSKYSHATVLRRIYEENGTVIHSFGVRSGLKEEFTFAAANLDFHPFLLADLPALKAPLGNKPVYLTLDLDVLDPSVLPGTGTPEPGGAGFRELLTALLSLKGVNLVGFDLVELAPQLDSSGVSTIVACTLLRELLLLAQKC
ncbi:MAG: agmatinase [Saccharofermentanales bacterium]|jgi:agmatinase|nr:agmatinase [Bacillota bacterium]NLB08823.1 agmatinase [Clostridiales bacterium]